ncbi:MAG: hypothetical protein LUC37_03305, partial [Prevotella sp.]|nr:hypothetical protein [Prevotella sp.]
QYHQGKGYNDTYNETDMVTLENNARVQAANIYVDTIYMHKGTSLTLILPYRLNDDNASIFNYLRWFDYRTDGNFNCNWTPSGSAQVYDLLTPAISGTDRTVYRFANGYVVQNATGNTAMTAMNFYYPTDDEYNAITSTNFIKSDNDYYIVACDASIYTDFAANNDGTAATFGSANSWCEPTLAGRAIYYIIGVEDDEDHEPAAFTHYWELLNEEYHGGTNTGDEHYLDEYEITYPSRRLSNNTAEMVALNKDANAYAIPGIDPNDDPGAVTITLIDNENLGFSLVSIVNGTSDSNTEGDLGEVTKTETNTTLSGTERTIFFVKGDVGVSYSKDTKQTVPTDTQWYVANGSTITILVTKTIGNTIYNLARYKVTFEDDANLLTQTQVAGLSSLTGNEDYWWNNMTHRSPQYMEETYSQVASLLFDYDESVDAKTVLPNGQDHFYPFPMDWSSNSYAFFDGVAYGSGDANTTFDNWNSNELRVGTRFSMYSITNEYIGYWDSPNRTGYASPPENLVKDDSGYWLYIDASERPGTVAEITIDGNLCEGSKLYGTAWIKGAGGATSVDAGALFSIGGVTVNTDGTETHTPILRQATGQVRVTTRITEDNVNEPGLSSSITGKGADTNEWFQVYFSLMNDGSQNFDYYTLRVDNYCAGTDGGDYYFDELRVYVETPTTEVQQLLPICTDTDSKSYVRFDLDYETLLSRMGIDPSDYTDDTESTASVDMVIINRAKYYNGLAAGETAEDAFEAALISFYGKDDSSHQLPTLDFYINYDKNQEYDTDNPGDNIVNFNNDEGYLYRRLNGTIQELSMDCYTDMMAFTDYILLAEPHTEAEKTEIQKIDEFIQLLDDECAIRTNIFLSSTISLKVNGQLSEPLQEYCAGQVLHISPDLTYTDEDTGEELYFDGIYYDWFYGSKEEYTAENENFGGETLQNALRYFRYFYPDAEELDSTHTPPTNDGYVYFTQNQYDLIEY